jgi:uncharacterized membrane protein YeaQ/YmgE (transglycosylase-associated protein family)
MYPFLIAMLTLADVFDNFANQFAVALPGVIGAIIVILIGVVVGWFVGKIVNRIVDKTVERQFDKSEVGKIFRSSGFDLSNFVGGVIYAFIVVVAI